MVEQLTVHRSKPQEVKLHADGASGTNHRGDEAQSPDGGQSLAASTSWRCENVSSIRRRELLMLQTNGRRLTL